MPLMQTFLHFLNLTRLGTFDVNSKITIRYYWVMFCFQDGELKLILGLTNPCTDIMTEIMVNSSDDFRALLQTTCLGPWSRGYGDYSRGACGALATPLMVTYVIVTSF